MAKDNPKFLAVLPWLKLAKEIEVGPFIFWRWPEDVEKHIPKEEDRKGLINSVNKAFSEVKHSRETNSWNPTPLSSLSVISKRDKGYLFEEDGFRLLRKPVDVLNASALFATDIVWSFSQDIDGEKYKHPNTIFYKNSTDFTLYRVPLGSDSPYWTRPIRRRHGNEIHMGTPEPILKPAECTTHDLYSNLPLLSSLGKLLESHESPFSRRIFGALDLFTSAFTDSKTIHPYAEIVLLATAFEILLIPNYKGSKKSELMCRRFLKLFKDNEKLEKEGELRNANKTVVNAPWKGWWLYEFYGLRNDIVHGKEIDSARFYWHHNPNAGSQIEIAIGVFRLALMKILSSEGFHTPTNEDEYQSDKLDEFLSSDSYVSFPHEDDDYYTSWFLEKRFTP